MRPSLKVSGRDAAEYVLGEGGGREGGGRGGGTGADPGLTVGGCLGY